MPLLTYRVRVESMYNYLPWPSNMRTADHVLAMRIQEGAAGYGIYVMLLELLRDSETRSLVMNPKNLAFAINEPDVSLVERVITQYGLFEVNVERITLEITTIGLAVNILCNQFRIKKYKAPITQKITSECISLNRV